MLLTTIPTNCKAPQKAGRLFRGPRWQSTPCRATREMLININNIKSTTIPWGHNTPPRHGRKSRYSLVFSERRKAPTYRSRNWELTNKIATPNKRSLSKKFWILKEFFNMSAIDHLLCRKMMHARRIDERNHIAKRLCNVQFVGGKNDAFVLLMRQVS